MLHRIGAQSVHVDGDFLTLRFEGDVSLDEMKQVLTVMDGVIASHGRFGVMADVREMRSIDPAARRYAGAWKNIEHSYGVAVSGASLPIRTIISLISRALQLIKRTSDRGPLEFFKTEAEARVWLRKMRTQAAERKPKIS